MELCLNETDYLIDKTIIDILGYSSGAIICISVLPKIIKIAKTKSTRDISHLFLIISLLGAIDMFLYGLFINELPLLIISPIIFIQFLIIIIMKLVYDKNIIENDNKKVDSSKNILNEIIDGSSNIINIELK